MKFMDFAENIKSVYNEKFASSMCVVRQYKCLGKCVYIDCFIAGNKNEFPYGYSENDMFKISFSFDLPDDFDFDVDELPENLVLDAHSNCYMTKSTERHLFCNYKKVPYRKSKGSAEKIISVFRKFIEKLYAQVIEDISNGNIHQNFESMIKEKI